jgi:ATP-dependent exoDNAse (exonuclease V) alpha subunit
VLKDGRIRLEDGRTLPANYRQFVRGFAVTSYGSQGKTVDHVLFSDSAVKAATNRRQYYVTISRGRRSVRIFTTDAQQLKESVEALGQDELALDLKNPAANSLKLTPNQLAQRMSIEAANARLGIGANTREQPSQRQSP